MTVIEQHITVTAEHVNNQLSVVDLLAQVCPLSKTQIKQAISKGALWLSKIGRNEQVNPQKAKRLRRIKQPLVAGDVLHFYYHHKVLAEQVADAQLIADHQSYSIWYKPYGMLSQGSKWSDHCTIERFVNQYFQAQRSCFIVHRLDRAATGLIIIAHSKRAAQKFSHLFEHHNLIKQYEIIVHGDASTIGQNFEVDFAVDDKPAKSYFSFLAHHRGKNMSKLQVQIATGRKHQIRKHAAQLGFPVVGDRLHGLVKQGVIGAELTHDKTELLTFDLQLQAVKLVFTSPMSDEVVKVELPDKYRLSLASN